MLTLAGFSKQYLYGASLFGGVDATFRDGEIVALTGGAGSGKTSFLKAVAGASDAEGRVLLDGQKIERKTDKVIMVFDDGAVFGMKTVFDNLAYPLKLRGVPAAEAAAAVVAAAEEMGIGACLNMRARRLDAADRRRMSLARLLVRPARLCLVDEPTKGLEKEDAEEVFRDFASAARRLAAGGATVIYSTSSREEAMAASDRIGVLVRGELKQLGSVAEMRKSPESVWAAEFVEPCYNVAKATLSCENGHMKLVFGENDEMCADALKGRVAAGYIGREVLVGWFPEDTAKEEPDCERMARTAYAVGDKFGFVLRTEDGFSQRSDAKGERVCIRPDIERATLFDSTNEFSIMLPEGAAEEGE